MFKIFLLFNYSMLFVVQLKSKLNIIDEDFEYVIGLPVT